MEHKVIDNFKQLYNRLNRETLNSGLLEQVYRDDLNFIDPIHQYHSLSEFKAYCDTMYENVEAISFHFTDEYIMESAAVLNWEMTTCHPKLNGGKPYTVQGTSQLKFDQDHIYWHRDYYDLGEMIYQHVPLIGRVVRFLKERLQ